MAIRKTVGTVGTLAQGAVSTAVSVARHPIGSAAMAAGLVKGTTEASIHLVRTAFTGSSPTTAPVSAEPEAPAAPETRAPETPEPEVAVTAEPVTPEPQAPESDLPGPDVVAPAVPEIDDLPEPVVIEAEPAQAFAETVDQTVAEAIPQTGESFHTEPKAASRESDHGGLAGDREETDGYVEEIPTGDDEPVWTSETLADDEAESVFDEAAAKAVLSEAEILQKAAEQHKE